MLKPVWRGLGHNGCTGAAGASGGVGGTGDVRVAVPTPGEGSSRRPDEERSPEAASAGEHRSRRTCRVRSSSWLFQVSFGSGFSGPAHGWLGLISAPVHCSSSSAAASGPAPGCSRSVLALVFQVQLMDGSGSSQLLSIVAPAQLQLQVQLLAAPGQFWLWFLVHLMDGSGSVQLLFIVAPAQLQLQCFCFCSGFRSSSPKAPACVCFIGRNNANKRNPSKLQTPVVFGSRLGSSPLPPAALQCGSSHFQLVLAQVLLAFCQGCQSITVTSSI
ncbi:uncharacterized protein LOC135313189 isoform X1 [Phalacrocorax carbo]|uniref:uncharacterized protein LOC135313189 isoform X1 n=1 Tax=Phalacrocorax carbo TaxID=9209 RepID=UPI00311A1F89